MSEPRRPPSRSSLAPLLPFIAGGVAGSTATCVIQPIDTVKVHRQLPNARGVGTIARTLLATGGVPAFYRGLPAALGRQVVYGSARLGLFRTFSDALSAGGTRRLTLLEKAGAGVAAGGLGSVLGTPFDLALVRLQTQTDRALPEAARKKYTGVGDAFARIVREEGGWGALWKGGRPTVLRAAALNAAMLATNDQAKEALGPLLGPDAALGTTLASSLLSGLAASVVSLPFDMVKTRLQSGVGGGGGGFLLTTRTIIAEEGLAALWRGLGTYTLRIGPHAFVTLLVMDLVTPPLRGLLG